MYYTGLPQGQESQEKLKKWQKSGKNGSFSKKKLGNLTKFLKKSDFVSLNLKILYFIKPLNS